MKCPDLLVLSSYYDKELNDSACRELRAHLTECGECRHQLENFSSLSEKLSDDPMPVFADIRPAINKQVRKNRFINNKNPIWNRRIQIPAPLAAAAAIALVMGAFGIQALLPGTQTPSADDVPILENSLMLSEQSSPQVNNDQMAVIMPVENLDQLFELMETIDRERFDKVEEVVLPAEFDFSLYGESEFYKTADYQGGSAGE